MCVCYLFLRATPAGLATAVTSGLSEGRVLPVLALPIYCLSSRSKRRFAFLLYLPRDFTNSYRVKVCAGETQRSHLWAKRVSTSCHGRFALRYGGGFNHGLWVPHSKFPSYRERNHGYFVPTNRLRSKFSQGRGGRGTFFIPIICAFTEDKHQLLAERLHATECPRFSLLLAL